MDGCLLSVENLSLKRGDKDILTHVNLHLQPGEVHGLLGLNGSGKSSLAYALMGCAGYEPDEGVMQFDGRDITRVSITERARLGLTLAWQEPARFEGLPVGAYLGIGAKSREREALEAALEAVALAPAAYMKRTLDHTLSGGERKRIELAAVFAMQPKMVILDEPDSGVDILSIRDVGELIQSLATQGSAVLLITHRDEMITAAHTASLMCQGTILLSGSPDEVRNYYGKRCRRHCEVLGAQPGEKDSTGWRIST